MYPSKVNLDMGQWWRQFEMELYKYVLQLRQSRATEEYQYTIEDGDQDAVSMILISKYFKSLLSFVQGSVAFTLE